MKDDDHDVLIRIDENLKGSIRTLEGLAKRVEEHVKDDAANFDQLKRFMWMAGGALVFIQIMMVAIREFK